MQILFLIMSIITNEDVRFQMLEILYNNAKEEIGSWGVERNAMRDILKIPEKDMDFNMLYLTRYGLVATKKSIYVQWHWAKITDVGKNVFENKEEYVEQFPFIQVGIKK